MATILILFFLPPDGCQVVAAVSGCETRFQRLNPHVKTAAIHLRPPTTSRPTVNVLADRFRFRAKSRANWKTETIGARIAAVYPDAATVRARGGSSVDKTSIWLKSG